MAKLFAQLFSKMSRSNSKVGAYPFFRLFERSNLFNLDFVIPDCSRRNYPLPSTAARLVKTLKMYLPQDLCTCSGTYLKIYEHVQVPIPRFVHDTGRCLLQVPTSRFLQGTSTYLKVYARFRYLYDYLKVGAGYV